MLLNIGAIFVSDVEYNNVSRLEVIISKKNALSEKTVAIVFKNGYTAIIQSTTKGVLYEPSF